MKQKNYAFVDIVSGIFLLVLFFSNFLALLYITDGNIVFSGLISFFIAVLYFFVVEQMRKNKEALIRQGYKHFSLLFVVFFTVLSFCSFILMSHFINVEFNAKKQVQEEAKQKIQLVNNFVSEYDRRSNTDLQNFESSLAKKQPQAIVDATVRPYALKVVKTNKILNTELTKNNDKFDKVFQNWNRLSIMKTYTNLNQYVDKSLKLVNDKLAELPVNKSAIELSPFNKNQLPLNSPSELNKLYPPKYGFTLVILLIIHLGILLAYFLQETRDPSEKFELSVQARKLVREII